MKPSQILSYLAIPLILVANMAIAAQSVDKQLSVGDNLKLNIKVLRGEIKISSWDKNEISVKGTLDELSEGFILDKQGNQVTLEDKMPRNFNGNNSKGSDFIIKVPKNLTLDAEGLSSSYNLSSLSGIIGVYSVSGDIEASDITNQTFIHTVSGDIQTSNLAGKIKLDTVSGAIEDRNSNGEISYKLVSGELTANSSAENVSIELISGDGKVQLSEVNELRVQTISGDISLKMTGLKSRANLDSVSGDIALNLPENIAANFNINGGPGGKIRNKLTDDEPKKEKYSPTSYLKFQTVSGGADIKISTISGSIELSD
ncbi:DUF4097 family beta strand repeat-containing protein [uncultured Shewanella sp.]|uniref:DUF4097 family beta strand repeat-containing protein n=1 Tax=uncultured Shewanella sp. TaxID=173975 RepID=UPI002617EF07|nr:DUF4097 family beta strand repeat-containing protein [uncultured Shewanella sp.]